MKAFRPGLLGVWLAGALLLLLWAFVLFGGHFQSPRGTQNALQARVQRALDGAGLDFAKASMRGQTAILVGLAPNALARARAERVALTAAGPGGAWLGAVARVRNGLTLAHADAPPFWRALRQSRRVILSGSAPSKSTANSLAMRAQALFGADLENGVLVVPFASPLGWEAAALDSLHQLARLDRGDARLVRDHLYFRGEGAAKAVDSALRWQSEPPPAGISVHVEVAQTGSLGDGGFSPSVKACQAALDAIVLAYPAAFDGQIEGPLRQQAIETLAASVRRCDQHRLAVTIAGPSLEIANQRAEALARDLLLAGANGEHMRVNGLVNLARPGGAMVIVRATAAENGESVR